MDSRDVKNMHDVRKCVTSWSWYKKQWVRFRCYRKYKLPIRMHMKLKRRLK